MDYQIRAATFKFSWDSDAHWTWSSLPTLVNLAAQSFRDLPVSRPAHLCWDCDYKHTSPCPVFFVGSRDLTQVFVFVEQVFQQMSHLPTSYFLMNLKWSSRKSEATEELGVQEGLRAWRLKYMDQVSSRPVSPKFYPSSPKASVFYCLGRS